MAWPFPPCRPRTRFGRMAPLAAMLLWGLQGGKGPGRNGDRAALAGVSDPRAGLSIACHALQFKVRQQLGKEKRVRSGGKQPGEARGFSFAFRGYCWSLFSQGAFMRHGTPGFIRLCQIKRNVGLAEGWIIQTLLYLHLRHEMRYVCHFFLKDWNRQWTDCINIHWFNKMSN